MEPVSIYITSLCGLKTFLTILLSCHYMKNHKVFYTPLLTLRPWKRSWRSRSYTCMAVSIKFTIVYTCKSNTSSDKIEGLGRAPKYIPVGVILSYRSYDFNETHSWSLSKQTVAIIKTERCSIILRHILVVCVRDCDIVFAYFFVCLYVFVCLFVFFRWLDKQNRKQTLRWCF